jgi:hypothetical protein
MNNKTRAFFCTLEDQIYLNFKARVIQSGLKIKQVLPALIELFGSNQISIDAVNESIKKIDSRQSLD